MLAEQIELEHDEQILMQVRRHWFIILTKLLAFKAAALAPLILFLVLITIADSPQIEQAANLYFYQLVFLYLIWLTLVWMGAYNTWTNYYLDVWTITNRRVIVVDQKGFFSREVGSFRLERLQDINVDVSGFIATLLDYGSLQAQTAAGSKDEFRAHNLPHPGRLKSIILESADKLMDEYRSRAPISPVSNDVV